MGPLDTSDIMVGNDFVLRKPRLVSASNISAPVTVVSAPVVTQAIEVRHEPHVLESPTAESINVFQRLLDVMHNYSVGAFAILGFMVLAAAIYVGGLYWSARVAPSTAIITGLHVPAKPLKGPNMAVAQTGLSQALQTIQNQPINLTIGTKTVAVNSQQIGSWLKTVVDQKNKVAYIHVDQKAVAASLAKITEPYAYAPIDQITTTHEDGSSHVIVAGRNGTTLADTSKFATQISAGLLAAKGTQIDVPLQPLPFNALTPANFPKFIEVDVPGKRMFTYENGQLTRTWLVSAGAPETPTPIGRYKIVSKLTHQDMKGFNPNGTKYFQPNVQWINYFTGGNAIHGNYWRPLSWFGNINSSHGCVSLPNNEAKQIYDWAPIGTPVVTHN